MNFGKGASREKGGILPIKEIERRREALRPRKSVDDLCAEAGVTARAYYNLLAGRTEARRLTRSKLTKAIKRLSHEGIEP